MNTTRRDILAAGAAAGALCALGGCEKLVSKVVVKLGQSVPDSLRPPEGPQIDPAHHLLNRAGFGAWPGDVEHVRAMGAEKWIDQQLNPQALRDDLCDLRSSRCEGLDEPAGEGFEYQKSFLRESMSRHTLLRATYSKRQLFEVMVNFWSDHFNVNIEKGECVYLKPWDDRNVARKYALGKFRDLVRASATSPAMLVYLDGNQNTRVKPNENYGRELLELHTLGVHGGYTQEDVSQAARALTGWRVRTGFRKGNVYLDPARHDRGAKRVLHHLIPAGQNERDLEDLIDIACRHPATARHIAGKLVTRFVSEDPPPALVEKVAGIFRSTDGQIKPMVRTILVSEEFQASRGAKFKPPFRFVVSALRALGADTHAHSPLIEYLTRMGQGIFQYPTPDGYPDKASPWLGTLLWRWNLAFALTGNQVPSVAVPLQKLTTALGATGDDCADRFFEHCNGRAPTAGERAALREGAAGKIGSAGSSKQLLGLALACPAFQRY